MISDSFIAVIISWGTLNVLYFETNKQTKTGMICLSLMNSSSLAVCIFPYPDNDNNEVTSFYSSGASWKYS